MLHGGIVAGTAFASYLRYEAVDAMATRIVLPYGIIRAFKVVFTTNGCVREFQDTQLSDVDNYAVHFRHGQRGGLLVVHRLVQGLLSICIGRRGLHYVNRLRLNGSVTRQRFGRLSHALWARQVNRNRYRGLLTFSTKDGTSGDGNGRGGCLFRS